MKISEKSLFFDYTSIFSTLTSVRSSTSFLAVTRLTVHRRRQYNFTRCRGAVGFLHLARAVGGAAGL
eukprot:7597817-Pyramimonas_sp.AAC.1